VRETKFDIYRQTYDLDSKRILSTLIMGGYLTWLDATLAEWILIRETKITSFTIRMCTHTDNTYIAEHHLAILDPDNLKVLPV